MEGPPHLQILCAKNRNCMKDRPALLIFISRDAARWPGPRPWWINVYRETQARRKGTSARARRARGQRVCVEPRRSGTLVLAEMRQRFLMRTQEHGLRRPVICGGSAAAGTSEILSRQDFRGRASSRLVLKKTRSSCDLPDLHSSVVRAAAPSELAMFRPVSFRCVARVSPQR